VSVLSGGEKGPAACSRGLMLTGANVLVMDEPPTTWIWNSSRLFNKGLEILPDIAFFSSAANHQSYPDPG